MDTPRLEVKKFYIFLNFCFFLILFDPTNNKNQSKIVIKMDWEDIWMGWEEIRWRKECGMGERQTKHTKTENRKKKKRERERAEHTIQSRTAPMCFPFRCYTRFTGSWVPKSMLFLTLVFMKILVRFGVPFGVPFWWKIRKSALLRRVWERL